MNQLLCYLEKHGILLCNQNPLLPALEDIGCSWNDVVELIDSHQLFYCKAFQKRTTYLSAQVYYLLKAVRPAKPLPPAAGQLYALEDGEISMLRSRGAGKLQIVGVYVGQSTILALAGGVIGLLLGFLLCVLIGTANGFMSFENPVDLSFRPGLSSIGMMLAAALVSVLVMTLPVLKYARVTIVEQKRKKRSKPIWQRFFLDFLCVAVSTYGWYSFGRQ